MRSLRTALAAALLPLLSACTATVPFDLSDRVLLQSTGGAFSLEQPVDLTTVSALWSRRTDIDAVSVDELRATVVSLGATHRAAEVTFQVALRADGAPADGSQDVPVGSILGLPFTAGASGTLPGSAAVDAFLADAIHGSGRFTVVASGSLDDAADAVLELELLGSASYQLIGG